MKRYIVRSDISLSFVHYVGGGLLRVTPVVVEKALLVGGGGRANKPPPAVVGVIEATPHYKPPAVTYRSK